MAGARPVAESDRRKRRTFLRPDPNGGPQVDKLPEKGTIGIFLFDVVTATDVAGNVTEKQNYEWYFNYDTKNVEQSGEVKIKRGFVDAAAFQQQMARERQAQMQ